MANVTLTHGGKGRGLYGQTEGHESRNLNEWIEDRIHENDIAEGEWKDAMIAAALKGNLKEMSRLRDAMKSSYIKGGVPADLAQDRADANLRIAMGRLRL
jgi:hypothetical protein